MYKSTARFQKSRKRCGYSLRLSGSENLHGLRVKNSIERKRLNNEVSKVSEAYKSMEEKKEYKLVKRKDLE